VTPCKWDNCLMVLMHITWVAGSLVVTLAFIISAIALFAGVFWYDACNFLDVSTHKQRKYIFLVKAYAHDTHRYDCGHSSRAKRKGRLSCVSMPLSDARVSACVGVRWSHPTSVTCPTPWRLRPWR
jgi:hypothetical protein